MPENRKKIITLFSTAKKWEQEDSGRGEIQLIKKTAYQTGVSSTIPCKIKSLNTETIVTKVYPWYYRRFLTKSHEAKLHRCSQSGAIFVLYPSNK
ncbi:MAG: hypothetical protein DWQ44_13975 [Bacteroidetes bacterium]|nr:MAG: hypothetical protein DWQ33_03335 [Bacteroidota bacterium]REK07227.1 MAG: hypothetical protein DWQ39_01710 [Bacteroidota bacterium]REK31786.1 MAG: hypothetical protein DWQ44_13975 [Bacteroidota bacterium]REK48034.1 MAG: hypothetical protein DWQ48_11165 [Bacteroidota bacterium]